MICNPINPQIKEKIRDKVPTSAYCFQRMIIQAMKFKCCILFRKTSVIIVLEKAVG
jgi:hypothetical protein